MSEFKAKCILFDIKTKSSTECTVTSVQDIIDIASNGVKDDIVQINIDKYHKVYYNHADKGRGVSGWVIKHAYFDSVLKTWINKRDRDFFVGDKLLFVLCDDNNPIDITEDAYNFITSCISC